MLLVRRAPTSLRHPNTNCLQHQDIISAENYYLFLHVILLTDLFHQSGKNFPLFTIQAGVSIMRAEREIDYGWFFMGGKRRENYDDWWRCEISFQPDLDELFGVSHNKQGIQPTPELRSILEPDLEEVAKTLHRRVRERFIQVAKEKAFNASVNQANTKSQLLLSIDENSDSLRANVSLELAEFKGSDFFRVHYQDDDLIQIQLNRRHPFYRQFYLRLEESEEFQPTSVKKAFDLFLISFVKASFNLSEDDNLNQLDPHQLESLILNWSRVLKIYLSD
ncbi:MAG: hypothetical protein QGH37_25375 [Candidatus Poribacteria bacterium]|nr:hypothetical protein [Candidatus Poribacteria bacterium]MDP6999325.1 hypothetical protein [Candidatus Poribacteria bacterium]